MEWLKEDLWRAHLSWLTPPWVDAIEEGRQDFNAKRWLDQLQSAHYRTFIFYTKHHDGYCTYPSKYTDFHARQDLLGECTTEARRRGLRVLVYYSSVLDQAAGSDHPDWRVLRRDGTPAEGWYSPRWPDAYCCIHHPDYRTFMMGQLAELRDNYNPDGFWLDVFEPIVGENCFCRFCRAKYRHQTGGGALEDTRDNLWYRSCYVDFLGEIRTHITKNNPGCVLGQNTGKRIPGHDRFDDFFTHEAFAAPTISRYCRSMRALGKPFETTSRLYSSVISWSLRGQDRVLLESLATVVHGGASCMELSPTPTGKIQDEALHHVAEAGRYIREMNPFLLNTRPVYDAGIFQPETEYGGPFGVQPPADWAAVFLERDIPFAFLYPDAELVSYPLLILDGAVIPDLELAKKLAEYVHAGGSLIVECTAAAFGTAEGAIMSEILGIVGRGKTGSVAHYLSRMDQRIAGGLGADDLIVEGESYRVDVTTAAVLAYYRYELTDRKSIKDLYLNLPPKHDCSNDAAITINHFGRGRAMYVACPLTTVEIRNHKDRWDDCREYPIQLADNLARFMINEPLLRGTTPAGVEVVVNRQGGRHIVHLLNNYMYGLYKDSRRGLLKLADVPVSINEKRIGHIRKAYRAAGRNPVDLPIHRDAPWAEVRIPELSVHDLIVLEH